MIVCLIIPPFCWISVSAKRNGLTGQVGHSHFLQYDGGRRRCLLQGPVLSQGDFYEFPRFWFFFLFPTKLFGLIPGGRGDDEADTQT